MKLTRRTLIGGLGAALGCASILPGAGRSASAALQDRRLVLVILRGGMDGLAAFPAYGDPAYVGARGRLAMPGPGESNGLMRLDGTFGIHPALSPLEAMYRDGEMAVVQAVGLPYLSRSHFDAQDILENGTERAQSVHDGWLNRALLSAGESTSMAAASVGLNVPLVLRGDAPVTAIDPLKNRQGVEPFLHAVERLYADDPMLAAALMDGLETQAMIDGLTAEPGMAKRGRVKRANRFKRSLEVLGGLMADRSGPRVVVLESSGWDTHANQGGITGGLAGRFKRLSEGLQTLKGAMGSIWSQTVVMVVTEFGRTVAANGTGGTDHGTGGAAILLGGAVQGGRVVGDWPGLRAEQLYQGRDLRITTDIRSVFKGVLADHLGIAPAALHREVFPDSRSVPVLDGLIRG